ncbi:hypothetical protein HNP48_004688 [Acidovorax soli]|uniref:Uncharacterized protein n=1 Tax=Acidovorax soli TaxID=592050 RepID=A0A7X0PHH6_9BURK|nr:hypothetical protein [Acidovorax soli]MBB6561986.1 hypothetical protein [Acidovorax soli]
MILALKAHYERKQGELALKLAARDHDAATQALADAKEQLASLRDQEKFINGVLTEDEQAELLLKCLTTP